MTQLAIKNESGNEVGAVTVPALLAEGEINPAVVHQVVVGHLANRRQGTSSTKTRSDVAGSGRKLFRQKGLGRARMGDVRSPIRVHGGIIFGPHPRSYRQRTPKKMRRVALLSALRERFKNEQVVIVDAIPGDPERPRTKPVADLLKRLEIANRKVLFVLPEPNDRVYRSARNIPKVSVTTSAQLHAYDVMVHDVLLLLPESIDVLAARLGAGDTSEAVPTENAEVS